MEARTGSRVEDKVQDWERVAQKYGRQYPALKSIGLVDARLKFYRDMLKTYEHKEDLTVAEKARLQKLRPEMQQLTKRGQPGVIERWLAGGRHPFSKFLYEFLKGAREIYFQPWRQAAVPRVPVARESANPPKNDTRAPQVQRELPRQAVLDHIGRSLALQGFKNQLPPAVLREVEQKAPSFTVSEEMNKAGKRFTYSLQFNRDIDTGRYFADRLSGSLSTAPQIERTVLAGVNVSDLDNRMSKVDWQKNYLDPGIPTSDNRREHLQNLTNVNRVFKDLFALLASNDTNALKAHDQLVYKHFSGTAAEQAVANMGDIRRQHEVRVSADLTFNGLKPADLFNIANGGTVKVVNYLDETNWYRLEKGFGNDDINVLPVRNTIPGTTEDWLMKQGITNIPGVQNIAGIAKELEAGKLVKAILAVRGVTMERMIKADPDGKGISVDLAASEKERLYKPEKINLRESIHQYQGLKRNHAVMEENQVEKQARVKR